MREKLAGKDLRSISEADQVAESVKTQADFDTLFAFLSDEDRLVAMRSIDAAEKITRKYPAFLVAHKAELLKFCDTAEHKEFKWHLALLLPRVPWCREESVRVFSLLEKWARDSRESRIVRTNALQGMYDLTQQDQQFKDKLAEVLKCVVKEDIPSLNARIKKLSRGTDLF